MIIEKYTLDGQVFDNLDTVENKQIFEEYGVDVIAVEADETERLAAKRERAERKMNTDYKGTSISLTESDQNGMMAVAMGFQNGLFTKTVFRFANGTKFEMTPENFGEISVFFATKRNEFFQE
ncbi:MAG: Unknown protein [uncultured Sulfurovum sp.]|uniref:Uncharacterized protein n=1 Tax=uncultured Sulfurovum sp. TaxID=269237 RepID=A0A6S6SVY7_9BACT|nr:MAG: Unknown protein [uncultured Sulfurovum sp.]